MKTLGIIPARYRSNRFPGKPLAEINGKTLIQRVYEQAAKCKDLNEVVVATDDVRIYEHVIRFGKVVMTKPNHPSGTDRCLEAFEHLNKSELYNDNDILINIQGDQPFIEPEHITTLIRILKEENSKIVTLATYIKEVEQLENSDVVKVVRNIYNHALYFSRSPVPYFRKGQGFDNRGLKHIGIYGFHIKTLKQVGTLTQGALEQAEGLEQLRWLENGFEIRVEDVATNSISIDRKEDILQIIETT